MCLVDRIAENRVLADEQLTGADYGSYHGSVDLLYKNRKKTQLANKISKIKRLSLLQARQKPSQ